ncbi:MAG: type II secretion system protein N [Steroidobacteraceae bacterium]
MKIAAAAIAAFAVVLIARFPARWAAGALPRGTRCSTISGTLWSGACAGLAERGSPLGELTWNTHPLRLFTGRLSTDVALSGGSATARARIDVGLGGTLTARGLRAAFPLDRTLLSGLPAGMQGSVQTDISFLELEGSRITAIRGRIDLHGLTDARGEPMGDYRLTFPAKDSSGPSGRASGVPVGYLSDLGGGPLSVEGTVRLTPEPGYVVDVQVAARPGAPPDLVNAMRFLGNPDASGRRPFSIAGTF